MKVLVTRPRERAAAVCALLKDAGLEPVCLPVIETEPVADLQPLDTVLSHLSTYDWVVIASAAAARLFGRRAAALHIPAAEYASRGRPRIVAGPATAQALARNGLPAQVVSPFSAQRVLDTVAPLMRPGQRVLLPRGEQGLDTLANGLRGQGLAVEEIVVYRTSSAPSGDLDDAARRALLQSDLAAITFFSPSAVAGLDAALAAALPAAAVVHLKTQAVAACIGPTTAAAARAAGWSTVLTSPESTAGSLVSSLKKQLFPVQTSNAEPSRHGAVAW